jgi:hypothetical protein
MRDQGEGRGCGIEMADIRKSVNRQEAASAKAKVHDAELEMIRKTR